MRWQRKHAGSSTSSSSSSASGSPILASKHIVIVMEENQEYSTVVGNTTDWPNLNNLIAKGALPTNYYANTHPSIGNYFMLTCGQLLTNNDSVLQVWNVPNIARSMLAANIPFRVYAEGITRGYVGGDTGLYVFRHDPFAMYSDIAGNTQVAMQVMWPVTQFAVDVENGDLPEYSFIVPDIDDDAHTGTPQQADSWLQANVVDLLSSDPVFQAGGDGLLIVDFDEGLDSDTTYGGGHVAPVLWGPIVRAGYKQTSATVYQHQSILLTTMQALGLSPSLGAAASPPPWASSSCSPAAPDPIS